MQYCIVHCTVPGTGTQESTYPKFEKRRFTPLLHTLVCTLHYICHRVLRVLVTVCTMHFLTAIPNAGKYLELSIEDESYYPWQKDLFLNDPFKVDSGKVEVKNIPGWGIEINPKWLESSQYKVTSI